jgi:hypothetical protein
MSKKSELTAPEQALQETSAVNGMTKEPRTESCADTAVDESEVAALARRECDQGGVDAPNETPPPEKILQTDQRSWGRAG